MRERRPLSWWPIPARAGERGPSFTSPPTAAACLTPAPFPVFEVPMLEQFGKILSSLQDGGDVPDNRDTVDTCLLHTLVAVLDVWSTDGRVGALQLAREVDGLVTALRNP